MDHTTLTIRPSVTDDIAAIDTVLRRSYPALLKADYPPSVMVLAVPLITKAQPQLIASGTYYVAEDADGALVGVGGWTRSRAVSGAGDIRHVATDPSALRRGVGRALLSRIIDEARLAGLTRLDCLATRTAVPFYASAGFEEFGPCAVSLSPAIDFPAIRMQLKL